MTAIKYQTSVLETIAVQSIVEIESNKKGYTNSEIYKSILELKEKQLLVNLYRKNFFIKSINLKDMEMAFGQMVYIKKMQMEIQILQKAEKVFLIYKN